MMTETFSKLREKTSRQNFAIYRLNGMIASLHRLYYEHRSYDQNLLNQISLALDSLIELKTTLKDRYNAESSTK